MAKAQKPVKDAKKVTVIAEKAPQQKPISLNPNYLWVTLGLIFTLFCVSVFKNIQYPLFWADESMTVVGAQRVLEFGYPKVHDGKNVFYDLRHTNPKLGIDENTDAYVGGTSWGHYYYAAIGVKIAEGFDDIYTKTGIIRSTFAFIGVLGLVLFVFLTSSLFDKKEYKLLYAILFFTLTLFSVSLVLSLREARYYSLSIFLFSLIIGLYVKHSFSKPINLIVFRLSIIVLLWLLFMTFAPVFFITLVLLGLTEFMLSVNRYAKTKDWLVVLKQAEPILTSLLIALALIFPFLSFFKTFEISEAMVAFNGYGKKMYWENIATILKYFKNFELLWLAVALKLIVIFNIRKIAKINLQRLLVSGFTIIVFIVYIYLIARIPNFIYTRYIILLQPILVFAIVVDTLAILLSNSSGQLIFGTKLVLIVALFLVFIGYNISSNSKSLSGHVTEMFNQYKGPLDYTIPFIKDKYKKTDTLVVAANYEETSYMYYLGSKVVIGFIGNNWDEDIKQKPHILAYRKLWGNHLEAFQGFMKSNPYLRESFPIYDNPVNNIPELNFLPAFNHKFETIIPQDEQGKTELYYLR